MTSISQIHLDGEMTSNSICVFNQRWHTQYHWFIRASDKNSILSTPWGKNYTIHGRCSRILNAHLNQVFNRSNLEAMTKVARKSLEKLTSQKVKPSMVKTLVFLSFFLCLHICNWQKVAFSCWEVCRLPCSPGKWVKHSSKAPKTHWEYS